MNENTGSGSSSASNGRNGDFRAECQQNKDKRWVALITSDREIPDSDGRRTFWYTDQGGQFTSGRHNYEEARDLAFGYPTLDEARATQQMLMDTAAQQKIAA
jgi:hypothetical protein